ncbi:hypothetical protein BH23BAC3_BH23BAC3_17070 [soil metagenome]
MIQTYSLPCYFFLSVLTLFLMASCGTSDEIRTVEAPPRTTAERTPAEADTAEQFMEISVGLIDPVDNLDPLFANNLSSLRVISLIYDGLFTLDKNGEVVNTIAANISVADDSLTYTVKINTDLFYHDNTAFMSGVGRRVQASDIKWVFERTARANVPPQASELLMNISGYEDYFEDQRKIYDPERRTLDGVSGIIVEDSQTIRFQLTDPDPQFQRKLASPYLYIYPREAVREQGHSLKSNPAGTGAYQFQNRTDNTIVLSRASSDRDGDPLTEPRLNRIDFVIYSSESQLFQDFARGNLNWIPEVGPETKRVAFTADGELTEGYRDIYSVASSGSRQIDFYVNDTRRVNMAWLNNRLADFDPDSVNAADEITVHQSPEPVDPEEAGEADSYYLVTFTSDLFARSLLVKLQEKYLDPDSEFRLSDLRTPVSRSAIYTRNHDSFHYSLIPRDREPWFTYNSPIYGLYYNNIDGIESNTVPWKLFVEQIGVKEINGDRQ